MPARAGRDYLVFEDERIDYARAYRMIAALGHALVDEFGIRPGERVALAMRNYPEWALAFWAITSIGAVVVPLNAWWTGAELAYGLLDSSACLLIADAPRVSALRPYLGKMDLRGVLIARDAARDKHGSGFQPLERFWSDASLNLELPAVDIDPEDHATIFYTSGTTGEPKGALGTHRNICTNVASLAFTGARSRLRRGEPAPEPGTPTAQMTRLLSVPFFHVTGCHSTLVSGTYNGVKVVMMHKWNPERALELIERERISSFGGVPAMVWQVLESPDLRKRDTSSVRVVGYGGAPAAPELLRRIKEVFPHVHASNGYGMTETSSLAMSNASLDYEARPDSVGPPLPICDVKVVDAEGQRLPPGQAGELMIRGPNVVVGYWNKPEATSQTFTPDGWIRTGDIAKIDESGFVYIVDRAKDMLIRGGENVYCVEVEDILFSHPEVTDAAIIGVEHRILGEEVGAVVTLTRDSTLSDRELIEYCAERLAAFKVPVRVELRREPLPRNANGKILKRQLKQETGW
jgi:long-chain acyl-CoA synthetase